MPEERHDVHADPTQDHLAAEASDEVVAAAEEADKAIQEEHFDPNAVLASSDSDVVTSEKQVGAEDGSVDSVEPPASLFEAES